MLQHYAAAEESSVIRGLYLGEDISKKEALKIAKGVDLVDSKEADLCVQNWSDVKALEEKEKLEGVQVTEGIRSVDKKDMKMLGIGDTFKEGFDEEALTALYMH